MNKQIRKIYFLMLLMIVCLMGFATYVQFFEVDALAADSRNMRQLYQQYSSPRGSIVVDGVAIAKSVKSDDAFKYQRIYSNGPLYAPVTGFYSIVNSADRGIEASQNSNLAGISDVWGWSRLRSTFLGLDPEVGDVELTIRSKIQEAAFAQLKGHSGAVIASDPESGAILAWVSTPSYDPNLLASHDLAEASEAYNEVVSSEGNPMLDKVTRQFYPPGSTIKIIDTAAALATGDYTATSMLAAPQYYRLPGTDVDLPNAGNAICGEDDEASLLIAFRKSCNTPFAALMVELGPQQFLDQARAFGVGQQIPIDQTPGNFEIAAIASEIPDDLPDDKLALSAVGQQDVRFTPMQDLLLSMAVANGGVIMQPYLVKTVRDSEMTPLYDTKPRQLFSPTSAAVANALNDLMVDNVDNGYAYRARIPGVKVGGKSGTAQTTENESHSWFTGFAPAQSPKIAISVFIENNTINASQVAGEILKVALGVQ